MRGRLPGGRSGVWPSAAEVTVWQAVLETADEEDADVIVLGSRGRSALKSALLGSVCYGVVHNSKRPAGGAAADLNRSPAQEPMSTDRRVTQPSIFSYSPMSTAITSNPQSSNSAAVRGADAAIRTAASPTRTT